MAAVAEANSVRRSSSTISMNLAGWGAFGCVCRLAVRHREMHCFVSMVLNCHSKTKCYRCMFTYRRFFANTTLRASLLLLVLLLHCTTPVRHHARPARHC